MAEQTVQKQKEIKFLGSEVEAVRKLPDVYIGALGNPGYLNMYREILQNSLDEIMKGNTLDLTVIVSIDIRNYTCIIEDGGQGIELSVLDKVFSKLHSSSNYDKVDGSGVYTSGKNGMGATITNFLSKFFTVESYRMDGTAAKVEYEEGRLTKKGIQKIKCPKGKHGLVTYFAPSDMMGDITVTLDQLYQLTWDLCHMNKIGVKIIFNTINESGGKHRTTIENKRGIYEIIDKIYDKQVVVPIHYMTDTGTMKVEVLFTYDLANMDDPYIIGFANTSPSNQGTHIDGFLDGLIKYFRDYMNKIYLAGNKKLQVTAQDIRTGLRAVVSMFHLRALYTGQSKSTFSVEEAKPFVSQVTTTALAEWASKNPNDLQKICKYLRDVCEIRMKTDGEKIKMSDKYTASVISGMPAKYKKPNGKGPFEFWIVEGDSCASSMENNRDKSCQSLMPIRGKCLNAFTTPTKKYFENEEIASIFKVCGYNGYSKRFDPDQFKPEKVVIATDADADGSHIQCLLFGLFLRYLPFVITSGKLYVATPPLYGVSIGKNKMKFFSNNIEYIQYVQNVFCKENVICDLKKREYTRRETTKILYENMDYVKYITHVSNVFAIDPYLLEYILYNRFQEYSKFKTQIKKAYPYVEVTKEADTVLIRGLVGSKYQTVFLNQRLLSDCTEIIELIDKSDKYYLVNKTKVTLYGLMEHFATFEPTNITRYKGLGEMPPKMLGESTVLPGMGRSLQQYTVEDIKAELKFITSLQSDKSVFAKGIKIRKEDII